MNRADLAEKLSYAATLTDWMLLLEARNQIVVPRFIGQFGVNKPGGTVIALGNPNRVALVGTCAFGGGPGPPTVACDSTVSINDEGSVNTVYSHTLFAKGANVAAVTHDPFVYSPLRVSVLDIGSLICGPVLIQTSAGGGALITSVIELIMVAPPGVPSNRSSAMGDLGRTKRPSGGMALGR